MMAQPMPKRIECDGRHKSNNDQTCLNRRSNHGDKGDEDGAEDIDDGEDQIDLKKVNMSNQPSKHIVATRSRTYLDWPFPFRVLPSKVRKAEDGQTDGELCRQR